MRRALLVVLLAFSAPAMGTEPPVCEVVVAWDRPSRATILEHELAHCWGWTHGDAHYAGQFKPPASIVALGEYPNVRLRRVSTSRARAICGSFGCARGGLLP